MNCEIGGNFFNTSQVFYCSFETSLLIDEFSAFFNTLYTNNFVPKSNKITYAGSLTEVSRICNVFARIYPTNGDQLVLFWGFRVVAQTLAAINAGSKYSLYTSRGILYNKTSGIIEEGTLEINYSTNFHSGISYKNASVRVRGAKTDAYTYLNTASGNIGTEDTSESSEIKYGGEIYLN